MYCDQKIALLVLACSVFGQDAAAAEWALEGTLGQELQYNDNISLNPIRKDSVVGYILAPGFEATRKTGIWDLDFKGQADIRRYDDSRWDCDNFDLDANSGYRTKRSVFGLRGRYGVQCSYTLQTTDTGLFVPNNQSENYLLTPSWTWQWTARDQVLLDASYSKTSYSSTQGGGALNNNSSFFIGNDTYTVNLGGKHEWNPRLSLNEKLYFSNVQYTAPNTSTQNLYGFQIGADYKIDRFWKIGVGGGPVWVDTQPGSNEASVQNSSMTLGRVANINLSYDGQVSSFSIGYSNTVNPSAIGNTLQTQSAFANYSYHLTRDLLLDLSGRYSLSQSVGSQSTDNSNSQFDRTYFAGAAGLTWDLAKDWQLKGSYVYSWQDYQQDQTVQISNGVINLNAGKSDSNLVMLFLNYSWDGVRVSR